MANHFHSIDNRHHHHHLMIAMDDCILIIFVVVVASISDDGIDLLGRHVLFVNTSIGTVGCVQVGR